MSHQPYQEPEGQTESVVKQTNGNLWFKIPKQYVITALVAIGLGWNPVTTMLTGVLPNHASQKTAEQHAADRKELLDKIDAIENKLEKMNLEINKHLDHLDNRVDGLYEKNVGLNHREFGS